MLNEVQSFSSSFLSIDIKQGYALKNWVEGISDEKIRLKSVSPTFATEQKNVLIYG